MKFMEKGQKKINAMLESYVNNKMLPACYEVYAMHCDAPMLYRDFCEEVLDVMKEAEKGNVELLAKSQNG